MSDAKKGGKSSRQRRVKDHDPSSDSGSEASLPTRQEASTKVGTKDMTVDKDIIIDLLKSGWKLKNLQGEDVKVQEDSAQEYAISESDSDKLHSPVMKLKVTKTITATTKKNRKSSKSKDEVPSEDDIGIPEATTTTRKNKNATKSNKVTSDDDIVIPQATTTIRKNKNSTKRKDKIPSDDIVIPQATTTIITRKNKKSPKRKDKIPLGDDIEIPHAKTTTTTKNKKSSKNKDKIPSDDDIEIPQATIMTTKSKKSSQNKDKIPSDDEIVIPQAIVITKNKKSSKRKDEIPSDEDTGIPQAIATITKSKKSSKSEDKIPSDDDIVIPQATTTITKSNKSSKSTIPPNESRPESAASIASTVSGPGAVPPVDPTVGDATELHYDDSYIDLEAAARVRAFEAAKREKEEEPVHELDEVSEPEHEESEDDDDESADSLVIPTRELRINNLPDDATMADLHHLFPTAIGIRLGLHRLKPGQSTLMKQATVEFDDSHIAAKALRKSKGKSVREMMIEVTYSDQDQEDLISIKLPTEKMNKDEMIRGWVQDQFQPTTDAEANMTDYGQKSIKEA